MPSSIRRTVSQRNSIRAIPLALAVSALSQHALADDVESEESEQSSRIEMVVVTGHATVGLDSEITAELIQERVMADMADLFRTNPVISAGGGVSAGQKIVVRNIGEDALNIAIDGASQTNGVFHHAGRISLDPELLKRVEIEAGPGSATAGPGALGGSVHFSTKDPSDLLDGDSKVGGLIRSTQFSNGSAGKVNATVFGQAGEVFSAMLSGGLSNRDTLSDGEGNPILGTASEQSLGFAKGVFDLSLGQSLSISHEDISEEGEMPYKTEWTIGDGGNETDFSSTEINRKTSTLNYAFLPSDNDLVSIKATVYQSENSQKRSYAGDRGEGKGSTESSGINLQNTSVLSAHTLIYGLNYRDDRALFSDNYRERDPSTGEWVPYPSNSDEKGGVTGFYIQDVMSLLNDDLTVSAGARHDQYTFTPQGGESLDDGGTSLNLSANYFIIEGLAVSAGYAEALRGVEASDPYKAVSVKGYQENLKAETAQNTEFAIEYQNSGFSSAFGVFSSTIADGIVSATEANGGHNSVAPWGKIIVNLDEEIQTEGFTVDVAYHTTVAGISANFLSADTTVGGEKATRYLWAGKVNSIGDTLVLNAYWNVNDNLKLGWAIESVQDLNNIKQTKHVGGSEIEVSKPGYNLHDLYLNWRPLEDDSLSINFTVKNALNEQYRSHAAVADHSNNSGWEGLRGQFDAGRDVRLSIGYQF